MLIRYVPDVVRGEFVNVGVILREAARPEVLTVRFTRNWSRARALHRELDAELLRALENDWMERLARPVKDGRPLLEVVLSSFSNSLQVTEPVACLADTVPAEVARLMRLYVDPAKPRPGARESGRETIAGAMRRTFERAGVWSLMRKGVAASRYTEAGDPLRLDFGYRQNGTVRLFQAVSLGGDLDGAKVLALSARGLREGVRRVEDAALTLTAVVEPLRSEVRSEDQVESYRFGVTTMEREGIRVATTADLDRIAETAMHELNV